MRAVMLVLAVAAAPAAAFAQGGQAEIFASDAFRLYAGAFGGMCFWGDEVEAADAYPAESWELIWDSPYGDGPQTATLYKFHCDTGAYNVSHVWYLDNGFEGPLPVAFASPRYDPVYENGDSDGAVQEIRTLGYESQIRMVNSEFDPAAMTISSASLWRGLGDASSSGVWTFMDGAFVLTRYEIDASYDGEVEPQLVVTFDEAD